MRASASFRELISRKSATVELLADSDSTFLHPRETGYPVTFGPRTGRGRSPESRSRSRAKGKKGEGGAVCSTARAEPRELAIGLGFDVVFDGLRARTSRDSAPAPKRPDRRILEQLQSGQRIVGDRHSPAPIHLIAGRRSLWAPLVEPTRNRAPRSRIPRKIRSKPDGDRRNRVGDERGAMANRRRRQRTDPATPSASCGSRRSWFVNTMIPNPLGRQIDHLGEGGARRCAPTAARPRGSGCYRPADSELA